MGDNFYYLDMGEWVCDRGEGRAHWRCCSGSVCQVGSCKSPWRESLLREYLTTLPLPSLPSPCMMHHHYMSCKIKINNQAACHSRMYVLKLQRGWQSVTSAVWPQPERWVACTEVSRWAALREDTSRVKAVTHAHSSMVAIRKTCGGGGVLAHKQNSWSGGGRTPGSRQIESEPPVVCCNDGLRDNGGYWLQASVNLSKLPARAILWPLTPGNVTYSHASCTQHMAVNSSIQPWQQYHQQCRG